MRVLYGVQATGNGHITRARVLAPALAARGIEVDYLFSGRPADELFDMELFGRYQVRRGLTFHMGEGAKVKVVDTVMKNSVWQLAVDIKALNVTDYDLILTDFEPITAWAAKLRKVKSVGIAHQYSFLYPLPDGKKSKRIKAGVKLFAPVDTAVGVHWHHFDAPIAPPLIAPPQFRAESGKDLILVYMPYESNDALYYWFSGFPDYHFHVYTKVEKAFTRGNVEFRPLSREGFEYDLACCDGVITNCGFGLSSEALQYGKKILAQPMKGQAEQQSNAAILQEKGWATVIEGLNQEILASWLDAPLPEAVVYPNVAEYLADWVASGCKESPELLARSMWS